MIKHAFVCSLLFCGAIAGSSIASADTTLKPGGTLMVTVAPENVFIPQNYDNTDANVEIVLSGELPNHCFQLVGAPEVDRRDLAKGTIRVAQKAMYRPSFNCDSLGEEEDNSYTQIANLGAQIPPGLYQVEVDSSRNPVKPLLAVLPISEAKTEKVDNYNYLNVKDFFLTKRDIQAERHGEESADRYLNLRGEYKRSCASIKYVKITPYEQQHIIEVLPVVDLQTSGDCSKKTEDVWVSEKLPAVPAGRYLIHIRSAFGTSRNIVADL